MVEEGLLGGRRPSRPSERALAHLALECCGDDALLLLGQVKDLGAGARVGLLGSGEALLLRGAEVARAGLLYVKYMVIVRGLYGALALGLRRHGALCS